MKILRRTDFINTIRSIIFFIFFFNFSEIFPQISDEIRANEEYNLQKGDRLSIEVMDHPEFSKELRILPDGSIEYPLLGNMKIVGMTSQELGEIVKHNLEPYVPVPIVTVYVTSIYGEELNIIGYVNVPNAYQIYEPLDIPTALAKAGGIVNLRKVKFVKIIRKDGEIINLELAKLWFAREIEDYEKNKLLLYAGDTLIVPPPAEFNWAMLSAIVGVLSFSLSVYSAFK